MKAGTAWYRESEYTELRNLFVDGSDLPETYSEWLQLAESAFRHLQSQGHQSVKAYINLKTFPDWCKKRGLILNAAARTRFASEYAKQLDIIFPD